MGSGVDLVVPFFGHPFQGHKIISHTAQSRQMSGDTFGSALQGALIAMNDGNELGIVAKPERRVAALLLFITHF